MYMYVFYEFDEASEEINYMGMIESKSFWVLFGLSENLVPLVCT